MKAFVGIKRNPDKDAFALHYSPKESGKSILDDFNKPLYDDPLPLYGPPIRSAMTFVIVTGMNGWSPRRSLPAFALKRCAFRRMAKATR